MNCFHQQVAPTALVLPSPATFAADVTLTRTKAGGPQPDNVLLPTHQEQEHSSAPTVYRARRPRRTIKIKTADRKTPAWAAMAQRRAEQEAQKAAIDKQPRPTRTDQPSPAISAPAPERMLQRVAAASGSAHGPCDLPIRSAKRFKVNRNVGRTLVRREGGGRISGRVVAGASRSELPLVKLRQRAAQLRAFDRKLRQREAQLQAFDRKLRQREAQVQAKDQQRRERDAQVQALTSTTPFGQACLALVADVDAGLLPSPLEDETGDPMAIGAALRARLGLGVGGMGKDEDMRRQLALYMGRHRAALQDLELGAVAGGDWFGHLHGRMKYATGGNGRLDLGAVLPPDELETGLIGGRARVMEAGPAKRRPGRAQVFAAGHLPDSASMAAIEAGRIPPLNLPEGKHGAGQGVNGFVFAIEMTRRGATGASGAVVAGSTDRSPMRLALKGLLPFAQGNSYYSDRVIGQHREEWRVPQVVGGHSNIVPIRHAFFGSAMLVLPWVGSVFMEAGQIVGRTTWLAMPLYPTSLKSAAEDVPCSGPREAALWLLQALEAIQHMRTMGAVHRDIKADNFFLAGDGRLVLGDFGAGCLLFHGGRAAELEVEFQEKQRLQAQEHAAAIGAPAADPELATAREAAAGRDGAGRELEATPNGSYPFTQATQGPLARAEGGSSAEADEEEQEEEEELEDEEEEEATTVPGEAFEQSGEGSGHQPFTIPTINEGGAADTRAPELVAMSIQKVKKDSRGMPLRNLAQAYEMSDAWAAAKTVWGLLAQGDAAASALPGNARLYKDSAIPRLPQAGRELEAILRGLLQSLPSKRLRPESAMAALRALLYGPQSWEQVERAAGEDETEGGSSSGSTQSAAESGSGAASGAGAMTRTVDASAAAPEGAGGSARELEVLVRRQLWECAAVDTGVRGVEGAPAAGLCWGLAGPAPMVRLPIGEEAYGAFGWGERRCVPGEASLWDRFLRREVLLRGDGPDQSAASMAKDCAELVEAVKRFGHVE